jgi:hypothetical protein
MTLQPIIQRGTLDSRINVGLHLLNSGRRKVGDPKM